LHIREQKIPSANSTPYICVEGPGRNLWFFESGTAKIGCFDFRNEAFKEFSLPTADATPIGLLHSFCEGESDVPGIACYDPGAARQCFAMIDSFATATFNGRL
jgi:hypothetical protein